MQQPSFEKKRPAAVQAQTPDICSYCTTKVLNTCGMEAVGLLDEDYQDSPHLIVVEHTHH